MNNQPTIEAYKSFYQQAKDFYAAGDIPAAREAFLRAAELANQISVGAKSYDVKMEYHKLAAKILDFVKTGCSGKKPVTSAAGTENDLPKAEEKPSFTPVQPSGASDKITFADVAGLEDVKEQITFKVLSPMQKPELAEKYHIRAGGKILLYGPPGTGKTFIARAIAGEVDAEFFAVNCQDLISKYMGDSSKQLDSLFAEAEKHEKAIIFFDEFDSVASKRGDGTGGVDAEMARFVATFLTKVDGFKPTANKMLLLIAATNRPDILDPALLRPGRFDRQITVNYPDVKGREAILKVHAKGKPLAKEVSLEVLAKRTPGFTGADLSNLVNEAALLAARRNKHKVCMTEMEEAIERVIAGPERKSHVMSDEEKRLTAYHEGGHTLVGMMLKHADPVHKVTIIPRGRAGGYTLMLPKEDRNYATRSELLDRLKVAMGGRVAEEVVLKEISTGASQDIQQASRIVRSMIMQYGMSDVLGPVAYGESQNHQVFLGRDFNHQRNYSEEVASEIDKEVRKYMEEAYEACRKIITENRDKLELIAQALMERETLTAKELEELLTTGHITDPDDPDEDDKPSSGTPAVTPLPVEQEEKPEEAAKETEKETEEEHEKEAEPKFNVTHYDK